MSGAQTSTFADPNILYKTLSGAGYQEVERNRLLNQETQQTIGGNNTEMVARAAATLADPTLYPTEEARAAAYPGMVARLKANGYAPNAPEAYPGLAHIQAAARLGTPSQTQQEWQANIAANKAYTAATGTTATAPAATAPAASTAPATSGTVEPDALARAQVVRDGLIKRGLDVDTATGFAANALHESGANPNVGPGDAGASHGTFQWNADRLQRYQALNGHPPDNAPLDEQLDFVVHELGTTEGAARDRIAAARGPAGKAAAISQFYLRPKDVQPEIARRSATATQLATQWGGAGTSTAAPVITGDSLASQDGLGGTGVRGDSPAKVLARVQADSRAGKYSGQPVVLSTGASNDPTDLASVEQQIREAQGGNAGRITVLGVGPGVESKAPGTNAKLQALAKSYGADFVPLPADQMSPDGVHPTAQGYATLKAAIAPPQGGSGGGGQPGRYQVASNAPVPPPASTAPAAGDLVGPRVLPPMGPGSPVVTPQSLANTPAPQPQAQVPQPPANRVMPGSADGPPAATPPAPVQPAPAGGPQPPQLQPLNARGLTAQQQAQIDAVASTGRMTVQQRMAAEQAFVNQNIQLQQKQFSDWIQVQQLQTSQGQLSVSQQNSALEYWKAAHPDAKVTLSGGEIITQDPRNGQEIAPRIKVVPNEAPRSVEGTAVEDNGQWRQPKPGEQGVPGKWTVGPAGGQFFPEATAPAQAGYDVNKTAYTRNSGQINGIADKGEAAQADQVRLKEMQDQLERIVTGPGTATKVQMAAWLERWLPNALNPFNQQTQGLTDAAAAEVFNKLAFRNATTQERSVAGSRGAGSRMTEMFLQSNPGLELLTDANRRMLNVMRIANQADIDKTQGAQDHFVKNEQAFRDSNGKTYTSLESYNADWQRQRNPEVFAAAASAAAGLPARDGELNGVKFKGWANELNDAEEKRVLEIVARAAPGTRVNTKGGDIIARPQAPATPPIPSGWQVVR